MLLQISRETSGDCHPGTQLRPQASGSRPKLNAGQWANGLRPAPCVSASVLQAFTQRAGLYVCRTVKASLADTFRNKSDAATRAVGCFVGLSGGGWKELVRFTAGRKRIPKGGIAALAGHRPWQKIRSVSSCGWQRQRPATPSPASPAEAAAKLSAAGYPPWHPCDGGWLWSWVWL